MNDIKKVLIIRFSSIGDIILTSPLLRILRKKLPDTQIDFLIKKEYAELVKFNPNLSNVIEFNTAEGFKGLYKIANDIKENNYDIVLDLHNNLRSNYIKLFSKARYYSVNKRVMKRLILIKFKVNLYSNYISVADRYLETISFLNVKNDNQGLDLYYPETALVELDKKLKYNNLKDHNYIIGVAPAAKHNTKIWEKEKYVQLLTLISNKFDPFIFLFGSKSEENYINSIADAIKKNVNKECVANMAGKLSLIETAALIDKCLVVITNDTGLMHMASARKRKVVAIFGSTVKEFGFFPFGTESIVIENNNLKCRPCSHIGRDKCPKHHFKCMRDISVERVLEAYKNILNIL